MLTTRQFHADDAMPSYLRAVRWTSRRLPFQERDRPRWLLVVDDYFLGAYALTAALLAAGYGARFVRDGDSALQVATAWFPEVAVVDISMHGGWE